MYHFENSCSWDLNTEIFMYKGTKCSAVRQKEQMEQNTNNQEIWERVNGCFFEQFLQFFYKYEVISK